jgi:hypothetical protein
LIPLRLTKHDLPAVLLVTRHVGALDWPVEVKIATVPDPVAVISSCSPNDTGSRSGTRLSPTNPVTPDPSVMTAPTIITTHAWRDVDLDDVAGTSHLQDPRAET